jgi:small subunit ribosomal protein S9
MSTPVVKKPAAHRAPVKRVAKAAVVAVKKPAPVKSKPAAAHTAPAGAASGKQSYDFLHTVGRRKSAIARVRLFPKGQGNVVVNNLELAKYFPTADYQQIVLDPLKLVGLEGKVDVRVMVAGGGKSGQAVAVRHGISRALLLLDPELRKNLRTAGFLTRDSRVKERKKYGLKKARRAPQFSKR